MGNIVLLDDLTINKIAAGEVVERPASVIKEMVENSIDAGATSINVEIRNGGVSYIRITDNGRGIEADDMELAFERHATSKIRQATDLETVRSMGFRGEALASIAAIANVEMISKTSNSEVGNRIVVEGGNILTMEETGCQVGTTITVQNLFFNTPVRYKFLKKDYTESGYIEDAITRLALINPNIAFKLINTGKTIIQTSGNGNIQDVIYAIYGRDIAGAILNVDYFYDDIHITGVVGKPEIARSNRSNQLFFVNRRFVKDKTLSSASEKGFKGLLPIGKYGFLILNIDLNPSKVDVNVHPAKLEVRFQEDSKVFKAVYNAIKDTLLKAELVANVKDEEKFEIQERVPEVKTSISDVFRKISKNKTEEKKQENFIEDMYNAKMQELKIDKTEKVMDYETHNAMKNDIFKELIAMQQRLKKEAENNPNLRTNIDKLIKDTQKMKDGEGDLQIPDYEIVNPSNSIIDDVQPKIENFISPSIEPAKDIVQESQMVYEAQDNIIQDDKNNVLNIQSILQNNIDTVTLSENKEESTTSKNPDELMEELQEKAQNLQEIAQGLKMNMENSNYIVQESQMIDEQKDRDVDLKETVLEKRLNDEEQEEIGKIEENTIFTEQTEEQNINMDETKFTSQQIEEMLTKLNNMDNSQQNPEFNEMYKSIFGKLPASVEEKKKEEEQKISAYELIKDNNISVFEDLEEYNKPTYKLIGIAFKTYIIIEIDDEMYIIDQHAAHERIMYEKVKKNYYSEEEKDSQLLLLPDIITLTHKEMDIAKDNFDLFRKAGFMLDEFGENTIKLSGVPDICLDIDTKELFLEVLDEINTVARTAKQEIEERFIATVACKAAVKANMALTTEEVDALMNDLLELPNPFTCPHGRPTAIKMDKNDIEKKFARRK